MNKNINDLPNRKRMRLYNFDYTQPSFYHVVICLKAKNISLGKIVDDNIQLSVFGEMAAKVTQLLPQKFTNITLTQYAIMPDHIHFLFLLKSFDPDISAEPLTTKGIMGVDSFADDSSHRIPLGQYSISEVIRYFKNMTLKAYIENQDKCHFLQLGQPLWQRSFYDHVIRDIIDFDNVVEYIYKNPIVGKYKFPRHR